VIGRQTDRHTVFTRSTVATPRLSVVLAAMRPPARSTLAARSRCRRRRHHLQEVAQVLPRSSVNQ